MPPRTRRQEKLNVSDEYSYAELIEKNEDLQIENQRLRDGIENLEKGNTALKRNNTRLKNQKDDLLQAKTEAENKGQKTKALLDRQRELRNEKAQKQKKEKLRHHIMLEEQAKNHEAILEEEDIKTKELFSQMTKLKQNIAASSSSRLDNQITDERFRETMSYTFVAIKDCFWVILRKSPYNIEVKLAEYREDLDKLLPNHQDNTKEDRLHVCISIVASLLVEIINFGSVFGWPFNDRLEAATRLWHLMPEPRDSKFQKKIKQWLSLTRDILTDSDRESMKDAEQFVLEDALSELQRRLEGLTDMKVTKSILDELSDAISPFLQVFCMLAYQRCEYTLEMVPAATEGQYGCFDPAEMEGMLGEKTGVIKASLFPLLCRLEMSGQDDTLSRTVIYKAKVAVAPQAPDTENDTDRETNFEETTGSVQASVTETMNFPEELQRDVLERMRQADVEMSVSVDERMRTGLVDVDTATIVDAPVKEDITVVSEEVTAEIEVEVEVEIESESGRVEGKVEESKPERVEIKVEESEPERVEIKVEETEYEKIIQDSFDEEDETEGMDLST
ncbi:hypothetical protein D6D10_10241 [Aureobasidium pullulans]|uniref:Uncharacterized protein n=1 Tax=Aureobasidium pullulans TaxID=5580 RepID=A0A4S9DTV2_AURPU|nr:hypothetical protein D6D10_10241 [Aureobasidium pullulans]